jgi:hypothetical protein
MVSLGKPTMRSVSPEPRSQRFEFIDVRAANAHARRGSAIHRTPGW